MSAAKPRSPLPVDHPIWQSALRAPFKPDTDEEREVVAAARNSGPPVPWAEVMAEVARRRALRSAAG
jgi:hypothetical protein